MVKCLIQSSCFNGDLADDTCRCQSSSEIQHNITWSSHVTKLFNTQYIQQTSHSAVGSGCCKAGGKRSTGKNDVAVKGPATVIIHPMTHNLSLGLSIGIRYCRYDLQVPVPVLVQNRYPLHRYPLHRYPYGKYLFGYGIGYFDHQVPMGFTSPFKSIFLSVFLLVFF